MSALNGRLLACFAGVALGAGVPACAGDGGAAQPATGMSVTNCLAIGGAMKDDNADLMKWMTLRKDTGKVVVIAYATSRAEGADTRMSARLEKFGWKGTALLLPDVLKGADERKTAVEWLPHADLIFMTGGDQSRIMQRFKAAPDLRQALDYGMSHWATPVAGSSAGAAVMSNPMFTGGGSESALAGSEADDGEQDDPPAAAPAKPGETMPADAKPTKPAPRKGVQIGEGLGIVSPMIDTHFFARGRVGRLVAALEASKKPFGLGIDENRAVSITGGSMCTAIGDCGALLVDTRDLKREGGSRTGVRINLLSSGDRWDWPVDGQADKGVVSPRTLGQGAVAIDAPLLPQGSPPPSAWAKGVTLAMLKRLAANPHYAQNAESEGFRVCISADPDTRFGWSAEKPGALTVTNARLEIYELTPADRAERAARRAATAKPKP
ncbi:MAG: cyanophycinase [Phycisphaerales bacterium]|nr:cyanophycinase [Phycisphaerales bacterium]